MLKGLHVAILGIDGVGKEPIVAALVDRLGSEGVEVERVTWQGRLMPDTGSGADSPSGHPNAELHRLWLDVYASYFAGASVHGEPVPLPSSYREAVTTGAAGELRELPITGLRAASLVATGWLEMAGFTLLHDAVVRPLVDSGRVVLQESLGIDNLFKSLVTAAYADDGRMAEAIEIGQRFVPEIFGHAMAPDVGVYLAADPDWSTRRRSAESISVFESFRAIGGDPLKSYLALQTALAKEFDGFAQRYDWLRVDVTDRTGETEVREIAAQIAAPILDRLRGSACQETVDVPPKDV